MRRTTRAMSDAHEAHLAEVLGGKVMPGSGNQWNRPMDVRQSRHHLTFAIAADGKSTLDKSIGVSREMWAKAVEQSHGERTVLPLRFYDTERLKVGLDLVVLSLDDFAEVVEMANRLAATVAYLEHFTSKYDNSADVVSVVEDAIAVAEGREPGLAL